MRKLFICLAALGAAAIALPVATPASAQDKTIIIKKDRGHHYGWRNNDGWRRHNAKVVVIKKERRHHDHD